MLEHTSDTGDIDRYGHLVAGGSPTVGAQRRAGTPKRKHQHSTVTTSYRYDTDSIEVHTIGASKYLILIGSYSGNLHRGAVALGWRLTKIQYHQPYSIYQPLSHPHYSIRGSGASHLHKAEGFEFTPISRSVHEYELLV